MPLSDHHREILRVSAIRDEVIDARGYQSIRADEAGAFGFARWQRLAGLLIPSHGVDCTVRGYQLRADDPRISNKTGKPIKYETPIGSSNSLDMNPLMRPAISKARQAIFITEGAKKADALASVGIPAISLTGVWNWRGKNPAGGYTALPDWEDVNIRGSRFVIAFDSDVHTNPMVNGAMKRLRSWLLYKQADSVKILQLPFEGTEKLGVDDYLASLQKA